MSKNSYLPANWDLWTPLGKVIACFLTKPYAFNAMATPQWKIILRYDVDSPECDTMLKHVNELYEKCKQESTAFLSASEHLLPYRTGRDKVGEEWIDNPEVIDFTFSQAVEGLRKQEKVSFDPPLLFAPVNSGKPEKLIDLPRGSTARCLINLKGYAMPRCGIKAQLRAVQYKELGELIGGNREIKAPDDLLTPEEAAKQAPPPETEAEAETHEQGALVADYDF